MSSPSRRIRLGWWAGSALVVAALVVASWWAFSRGRSGPSGAGLVLEVDRDALGRPTREARTGSGAWETRYEPAPASGTLRVARRGPGGAEVVAEYDRAGRRVALSGPSGTARYDYDPSGTLRRVSREGAPAVALGRDGWGRVDSVAVGDDPPTRYARDLLGRIVGVDGPAGRIAIDHDAARGSTRRLPNGVVSKWDYRPDGAVGRIEHRSADGSLLASYEYEYRPDGRIASVVEATPAGRSKLDYAYDRDGRLESAVGRLGESTRFERDPLGNETARVVGGVKPVAVAVAVASHDWAGRLTALDGRPCEHDPAGNLVAYPGAGGEARMGFDARSALVSASRGRARVSYRYDDDGQLVARSSGGSTTRYTPDPAAGAWRPLAADEDGRRTTYVWAGPDLVATVGPDGPRYVLTDHLGSVRMVLDASGVVVERLDYDPFGRSDGLGGPSPRPGFAGLLFDPAAGLYLTERRAYDPALGRFLQRDPVRRVPTGAPSDFSAYLYCGGDPVNFVDRDGADGTFAAARGWLDDAVGRAQDRLADYAAEKAEEYADGFNKGNYLAALPGTVYASFATRENQKLSLPVVAAGAVLLGGLAIEEVAAKAAGEIPAVLADLGVGREAYQAGLIVNKAVTLAKGLDTTREVIDAVGDGDSAKVAEVLTDLAASKSLDLAAGALSRSAGVGARDLWNDARSTYASNSYGLNADLMTAGREVVALNRVAEAIEAVPKVDDAIDVGKWALGIGKDAPSSPPRVASPPRPRPRPTPSWSPPPIYYQMIASGFDPYSGVRPAGSSWSSTATGSGPSRPAGPSTSSPSVSSPSVSSSSSPPSSGGSGGSRLVFDDSVPKGGLGAFRGSSYSYDEGAPKGVGRPGGPSGGLAGGSSGMLAGMGGPTGGGSGGGGVGGVLAGSSGGPGSLGSPSAFSPGPVGGVYLRGAGRALGDLGMIRGMAVDERGRLTLVADDGHGLALPPLRIDDVVTVFRSVYDEGTAPFVSIDPDPKDLQGPTHHVVLGETTRDTYVGWILFQTDRVMKVYGSGVDNITRRKVASRVPGYRNSMEIRADLDERGSKTGRPEDEAHWQRNWIVPASVERSPTRDGTLTLFDVPLKVNTVTEFADPALGKLVEAPPARQAESGRAFAEWFTRNYDRIAADADCELTPPAESGVEGPVQIFDELRRIALIAAVAERMSERGLPMPSWMREVRPRACPTPRTTPAIDAEYSRTIGRVTHTYKTHGGVRLQPSSNDVREVVGAPAAEALAPPVRRALAATPTLRVARVVTPPGSADMSAVALPGDRSVEVGGNRLDVADLVVPVGDGGALRLARHAHSFFSPAGPLGGTWTLDLPRLERRPYAVSRDGDRSVQGTQLELVSPLGTWHAIFRASGPVPTTGVMGILPTEPGPFLGLIGKYDDPRLGKADTTLILDDGRRAYFDESGTLMGVRHGDRLVSYRNRDGRPERVESWRGDDREAAIRLAYDANGRLESAAVVEPANLGRSIRYRYGDDGRIADVEGPGFVVSYGYTGDLVSEVRRDGKPARRFRYDASGRLVGEWSEAAGEVVHEYRSTPEGVEVASRLASDPSVRQVVRFDSRMRPSRIDRPDGSEMVRERRADGGERAVLTLPSGVPVVADSDPSGRRTTLGLPDGTTLGASFDEEGRLLAVDRGGVAVASRTYDDKGRVDAVQTPVATIRPDYGRDGRVDRLEFASKAGGRLSARFDARGRLNALEGTDGTRVRVAYDDEGRRVEIVDRDGSVSLRADAAGRPSEVRTSWGSTADLTYADDGSPGQLSLAEGPARASVAYRGDRPEEIRRFDGGVVRAEYGDDGRVRTIRTAGGLLLAYGYDPAGRVASVDCGGIYRVDYAYDGAGRLARVVERPSTATAGR